MRSPRGRRDPRGAHWSVREVGEVNREVQLAGD
jgi:hypothetical protein